MAGNQSLLADHLRISQILFFSCLWAGLSISLCLVSLRFGIRWKLFGRLFWDDAFVAFAMMAFLAQGITWSIKSDGLFLAYDIATGRVFPTPDRIQILLDNLRVQLGALCLFFAAIWSVKISFMIFFRRIGERVQGYKIWWWWFVMAFVVVTFIISMALIPYRCLTGTPEYIITKCVTPKAVNHYYAIFYAHMGFDILTDLMIVSIPTLYLWNVKIPLKQKLGLIGLFSLTLVVIAVAIVRLCVINIKNGVQQSAAWIALWTLIEITMALVVASLGSFRQLFMRSGSKSGSNNSGSKPSVISSVREKISNASSKWKRGHSKTSSHSGLMGGDTAYTHDSEERAIEMKTPRVDVVRTELPRSEVPLKRASQAHIAHYSAAPTERRYMVVHPGETDKSDQQTNFI